MWTAWSNFVQFKLFKTIHCIKNYLTNSEKKCKIKWSKQELNLGSKPLIIDALTTTLSTLLNMSIKLYKNFTNRKIKKIYFCQDYVIILYKQHQYYWLITFNQCGPKLISELCFSAFILSILSIAILHILNIYYLYYLHYLLKKYFEWGRVPTYDNENRKSLKSILTYLCSTKYWL